MMKIRRLLTLLCVLVFTLSLGGCSFLGSGDGSDMNNSKVQITLHDGNFSKNFDVTVGTTAKIDELTKIGYFSTGYYTSENGGDKYFDASGKSLSSWAENYPTDFYVQYKPISEFQLESNHYTSKAKEFTYYEGTIVTTTPEFLNAMKANSQKTLNVTTSFWAYDSKKEDWVVYYKNLAKFNEGNMTKDKIANQYYGYIIDVPSSYTSFSYSCNIPVSKIAGGEKMTFLYSRGATMGEGAIKNLNITITIS